MDFSFAMDRGMGIVTGILSGVPSFGVAAMTYILTALGLYVMAKRRGITKAWMAWLPIADSWVLGSLSDQYRYVARGEIKSRRKILLVLDILSFVFGIVFFAIAVTAAVRTVWAVMSGFSEMMVFHTFMNPVLFVLALCLPFACIKIAYAVFYFMALYDVYTSCDPENSVLFLVLSILFGVTKPFFIFFNREREGGMPPRMDTAYQDPVRNQETY